MSPISRFVSAGKGVLGVNSENHRSKVSRCRKARRSPVRIAGRADAHVGHPVKHGGSGARCNDHRELGGLCGWYEPESTSMDTVTSVSGSWKAPSCTANTQPYATGLASVSSAVTTDRPGLSAVRAPAAPSFTARAVSGSRINLAWTRVSGARGYLVDEWVNGTWSQIGSLGSGATGDAVTRLSPDTTYYFDVAAYNSAGTSWANYRSATTLQATPAAPSLTATVVSGSQINLAWNGVSGACGYLVDEWVNGAWSQIGSYGSGVTGCSVAGLSPNTTYYFDVAAYNSAGTSWANYQSATTSANLSPPAAPSFTATAASGTQINLSWNTVSGASGYLVDEWINGAWPQIGSYGSGTTGCSVTGLSPGTTYYFDVAAYNSAGTSWANYQSAQPAAERRWTIRRRRLPTPPSAARYSAPTGLPSWTCSRGPWATAG